ncbi:hypothetical protein UCREL1_7696 [Eutypa lata UCREL1]|uniref:Uncharacterized protein n=1 Tax=Eutypa lata (strain UCR-EL1) TaxID=1287681 RepID=M7SGE0_EUTLA|nr:hypothetical protein UCREL1_7696 [Eutypa lata UCREL1]
MADSISSFFTSLFPSSKPPPKRTHNLRSDARTVGSTTPPTTSTAASGAGAGANNGNNNSNGRGPTTPAAAADASQQIRDQRAQFLDKLSSRPARGKWKGNNSNAKGSKPSVQSQASSSS